MSRRLAIVCAATLSLWAAAAQADPSRPAAVPGRTALKASTAAAKARDEAAAAKPADRRASPRTDANEQASASAGEPKPALVRGQAAVPASDHAVERSSDATARAGVDERPPCAPLGANPFDDPAAAAKVVDLNTADERTLLELPGIGPARARSILDYRIVHGGFRSISQLLQIKGIGRALLKQLRPLVTLSGSKS